MKRRTTGVVVGSVLAMAMVAIPSEATSTAESQRPSHGDTSVERGTSGSARELVDRSDDMAAQAIAKEHGVSAGRAAELMAAQESLHSVNTGPDAGFVEFIPRYTADGLMVKYLSTSEEIPAEVVKSLGALPDVATEFIRVPFSIEQLSQAGMRSSENMASTLDSTLSPEDGSVVFFSPEAVDPEVKKQVEATAFPVRIRWELAEPAKPFTGGGGAMSGCTGGFVVKQIGGTNRGMATAAHCGNYQTYTGLTVNTMSEAYSGNADIEWVDNVSISWDPSVWLGGPSNWPVQVRKNWDNAGINDPVCSYGKVTQGRCGNLLDKWYRPSYVPNAAYAFGLISHGGADGDSGGPIYYGTTAWGVLSGGTASHVIFTPQDRLETRLGVQVMIQ